MVKFDFAGQGLIIGIHRCKAPLVGLVDLNLRTIGKYLACLIYPLQGTVCRSKGAVCQRQVSVCQCHAACGNLIVLGLTLRSCRSNHDDKRCTGDFAVVGIACLGCRDNNGTTFNRCQNAVRIHSCLACAACIHAVSNLACAGAADGAQFQFLSIDHAVVTGDAQCLLRVFCRQGQYQILGKVFIIGIGNRYRPANRVIFRTTCQGVGYLSGSRINRSRFNRCRTRSKGTGNAVFPCLSCGKSCVIGCEGLLLPVGELLLEVIFRQCTALSFGNRYRCCGGVGNEAVVVCRVSLQCHRNGNFLVCADICISHPAAYGIVKTIFQRCNRHVRAIVEGHSHNGHGGIIPLVAAVLREYVCNADRLCIDVRISLICVSFQCIFLRAIPHECYLDLYCLRRVTRIRAAERAFYGIVLIGLQIQQSVVLVSK